MITPLALLREQLVNTGPYWANLSLYGVAITPALWLAGAPLSRPLLGALLLVGSMALVMAALCAHGTSTIHNIRQIDRGYEKIEVKLAALGANIERIEEG